LRRIKDELDWSKISEGNLREGLARLECLDVRLPAGVGTVEVGIAGTREGKRLRW
jgi:hypothetical protein